MKRSGPNTPAVDPLSQETVPAAPDLAPAGEGGAAVSPQEALARDFLRALFDAAVARASPGRLLTEIAAVLPASPPRGRTVVLGAGKAAAGMAAALDVALVQAWGEGAPVSGLVITRHGHVDPALLPCRIEVVQAGHPVPDAQGLEATQRLLASTEGLTADDLVIALFSGGGSALLSLPAPGLSWADKQAVHQHLLRSGAPIDEMNVLRRHLSALKGGRLAARCAPAALLTLLISDVPGDAPETIASGPTVPDPSTCAQALAIAQRHGVPLPQAVCEALASGQLETPKPGDACFASAQGPHRVVMLCTPRQALEAAAELARRCGITPYLMGDAITGEARQVGLQHALLARQMTRPCVLISGGETQVTLGAAAGAPGRGGRASEFLLACALALEGERGVYALAADTDGIDGSEGNAGAFAQPDTLQRAAARGLHALDHLERHDAYSFFAALDDLLVTGPTGTNVNEFRALLLLA